MSVTYTPAASRSRRVVRARASELGRPDVLLAAATLLTLLAVALSAAGAGRRMAPATNLNALVGPEALEPALRHVFADAAQRRAAAHQLYGSITEHREVHGDLPNVGVLVRARRSVVSGDNAPMLTASQLADLKPHVAVRTRDTFVTGVAWYLVLLVMAFQGAGLIWRRWGVHYDPVLLASAHLLTGIGLAAIVALPDPLRDTFLMARYTQAILIGLVLMTAAAFIRIQSAIVLELSYLPLLGALLLSVVLLLFGSGPAGSSAKVNLGPVQPIEAIRLLLALFLAGYFARRWELLRTARETSIRGMRVPSWLDVPRLEYAVPVIAGVGVALFFFALQKDLGPALYTCCVFLAVYSIARGRIAMALAGLAALIGGFYLGHVLGVSQTLVSRVTMWRNPWDNAVSGGDQIAHAVWSLSSGSMWGTGLGVGATRYLPAGHTDLILAAIGEELGALGLVLVAVLYTVLACRGFRIAQRAHADYGFFLGVTMTLFLIVPALIMAAGVVGAAPLTGVVTPFLSYGGSAMVTNFAALGVLQSIAADRRPSFDVTPFRVPMRWMRSAAAAVAVVLCFTAFRVQVLQADEYVVRPHLGIQADGVRRYSYNPRVLDLLRALPRGTVYDRRGLPLATDDVAVLDAARDAFQKLGIRLDEACAPATRCYPLEGRAFHLLGDAGSRLNWSAPNASYVERDLESALRGFDDRSVAMNGTVRRDYAALVPLLRNGRALAAFRSQPHDVRTTIDASLQLRTAAIVADYAQRSGGKGAAVVLDAATGELLASVSYPWPESALLAGRREVRSVSDATHVQRQEALLDRARYGLYPPGSTFKLITAAAALRAHSGIQNTTFACARLGDGRVGAKIAGFGRPIRDDVLDAHPHGRIDLHDGLVRSCNAYFAQLAVTLGAAPLEEAAREVGIALTAPGHSRARVNETLPQIGYGQADVVATPLRMARVAAAIASDGRLQEVSWIQEARPDGAGRPSSVFLDRPSARLLGRYMRDAVVSGTGRRLAMHPARIAGKTGTAEVAGKPSHSWYVGFAPFEGSGRQVAFAVVLENAGYGSANAAPAAGEIVSAAMRSGLIK